MTRRAWGILLAAGVVVILAGVVAWRALGPSRRPPPAPAFVASAVPTDSPGLAVETDEVRGIAAEGRTQWRCLLRCREPRGCYAQLRVTVHYLSAGKPRSVSFGDTVRVGSGEVVELGGTQHPAEPVDTVQRLKVVVEQRLAGKGSAPTRYE